MPADMQKKDEAKYKHCLGVHTDPSEMHERSGENYLSTVVSPYQWGLRSKTPKICLKLWIVPNPIYPMFFPIQIPMIKFKFIN